jgi:acyl carrier protein
MPLTPSGKVDRSVLPSPEEVGDPGTRKSTTPTNDTESGLMGIWKELLACKTIGIHDNFFHLGGHSLLATQLISRIMSTFQIDLPVRVVFEAPTIAALARAIDGAQPNKAPRLRAIPKGISQTTARDLLSRVNDLTDIEVEELLRAPELQHVAS